MVAYPEPVPPAPRLDRDPITGAPPSTPRLPPPAAARPTPPPAAAAPATPPAAASAPTPAATPAPVGTGAEPTRRPPFVAPLAPPLHMPLPPPVGDPLPGLVAAAAPPAPPSAPDDEPAPVSGLFRPPAARAGAGLLRRLVGSVVAVALVAAGIAGLNLAFGHDPRPTAGGGPVVTRPTTAPPAPEPSVAPSTEVLTEPTPTAAPLPALTVLNASRRTGLAARAADRFAAKGWPIAQVGNYRRRVPVTTVYYEPGQEAAAARLRREFPEVRRALPRPEGLPGTGLTVVVTREFPA